MIFGFLFAWLLLVLAAARVTNILVYDKITKPIRDWIKDKLVNAADKQLRTRGMWRFWHELLECHWCAGVWASGLASLPLLVAALILSPVPWGLIVLAYPYVWLATAYAASRLIDLEG